jgi:hypothetical protein
MTATALQPAAVTPAVAANEADAAWERYGSTVRLGGTVDQRRWAFDRALEAERRCQRLAGLRAGRRP